MNIAVVGTGYVGLVTGTCLAEIGHKVICQDSDGTKIKTLEKNHIPIYEPHLEELVVKNKRKGRLSFTGSLQKAIGPATAIFICVGTPSLENGEADLFAIERVTKEIAQFSDSYKLIVEKSTVPVQTGLWVEKTFKIYSLKNIDFDVASNPEFLREGQAIYDFLHPDRIVIGVRSKRAEDLLRQIYDPIIKCNFTCPIHKSCPEQQPVPFIVTDINSSELIKHASNSFLAMKVSFINAISDICERTGASVKDVAYGMGLDKRIGSDFFRAGIGFGGSCFPKDLQAFIRIAEKYGYNFGLLKEVEKLNNERIERIIEKLKEGLWLLKGKTIGILGLSFKPDTDDTRFSPALKISRSLLREGATVKAYDPKAMVKAKNEVPEIVYRDDPYQVADGAEALVICTEWDNFKELNWEKIKSLMVYPLIVDGRNMLDKEKMKKLGFEYMGMGI